MNLRAAANAFTRGVNPNLSVTVKVCVGYGKDASYKQFPVYSDPVPNVDAQVQALSKSETKHLDSLNITNVSRALYVNMQLSAIDRVTRSGGDLLYFEGATWLVEIVLEGWTTAGWCKVGVSKQMDGPNGSTARPLKADVSPGGFPLMVGDPL